MEWNILIAGVGGQGTLLASKLLGNVAVLFGLDVKVSEVHGMAQRGGSVVTYVRIAPNVASPLIEEGGADVLLAFEEVEALRYIAYVKKNGRVIVNSEKILPVSVLAGRDTYPEAPLSALEQFDIQVTAVDATELAIQAGNARSANIVMAGVLSKEMGISEEIWMKAIEKSVPAATIDVNKKAFYAGQRFTGK